MNTLLSTLRQKRDSLVERGAKIAEATRDRGLRTLGKVQSGAMDWRRTLAARKAELGDAEAAQGRWFELRARVIDRADRVLAHFAARVRAEIKRLRKLELPQPTTEPVEALPEPAGEGSNGAAQPKKKKAPSARRPSASAAQAKKANGRREPAGEAAPKRFVLPINDYDALNVKDILAELPRLTPAQCKAIQEFELAHKKRKTVLAALEARLAD